MPFSYMTREGNGKEKSSREENISVFQSKNSDICNEKIYN